jgi:small subunit ribosomal protein S16
VTVKLRLMRMGKKKQPTYRVVAADVRSPRDGRFIEIVGTYDPRREPSDVRIDNDKAVAWLTKGAQPTERVRKLLEISGAWQQFSTGSPPAESEETAPASSEAAQATTATKAIKAAKASKTAKKAKARKTAEASTATDEDETADEAEE